MRVADQDRLPVRLLDQLENGREDARLGHSCLVDDEDGAGREAPARARVVEQPVECRRGDAGLVLELLGRHARRGGAEHCDARLREDLADRVRRGRLAGAGEADDADDAVGARRDFANHRLLLVREHELVGSLDLVEPLLGDRGRAGVAPALDECERGTLDVDELGRRVAGRTARARRFTDRLDAVGAGEAGREPADPLGGGAASGVPAPRPSRLRGRRTRSASR